MAITVLGLGPGNPDLLTRQAWEILLQAHELYLRTAIHPTVQALPQQLSIHSFDELYETLDKFDLVYETIVEQLLALGNRPQGVIYAVPGHPLVGESSVSLLLDRAGEEGLELNLVEGLSFVEPVLSLLGIEGLQGMQLADATDLATCHHPPLDPDRPALVGQLYGQQLASEVKLTLMNAYPDDHLVTLVSAASTPESNVTAVPLFELDRGKPINHLTTLYVPPLPYVSGLPGFQETVARLRAPDGCPWDREQTHESLRSCLLEETYEVLLAIDGEDSDEICEELGDLLMQIVMHAQIATEGGTFQLADVIGRIDTKLKRRHPHVFGDLTVKDTGEVLRNWQAIKANERAEEGNTHDSRLTGVPVILPALARAQAVGERASREGFDWVDVEGVVGKVAEEAAELSTAEDLESTSQELGDLLFTLVNLARWLGVDAESALRRTCDRFTQRFGEMETIARSRGIRLADLPKDEQESLWENAKSAG
jgi:tetrapyrrole methylase family protein/MazG family protein